MKHLFAIISLLCLCGIAKAQTAKGDWMVGGDLSLNTSNNNTQIGFTPRVGGFIINNLALGGELNINYSKIVDNKVTNFGIGPFLRYYFTNANVRPIIQGDLGYVSQNVKNTSSGFTSTNNGIHYFLGAGAAAFISNNVSIDFLMGYDHVKLTDIPGEGGFKLTVGFQVYLLKNQVNRLRRK